MGSLLKLLTLCASVLLAQAYTDGDRAAVQQNVQELQELFDRLSNSLIVCEQSNTTTTADEMVAVEEKLQGLREQFDRWNNSLNVCEQSKTTTTTTTTTTTMPTTTTAPAREKQVYTQGPSTANYLYAKDLPELSEFTICMQANYRESANTWLPFVSIATKDSHNAMVISTYDLQLQVYIAVYTQYSGKKMSQSEFENRMMGWHKHCWTYRSGAEFKWFATSSDSTVLKEIDSFDAPLPVIGVGGALVLSLDQDSVLGGFDPSQLIEGQVADFNLWNYAMDVNALNSLTCDSMGNVRTWSDLLYEGESNFSMREFECSL